MREPSTSAAAAAAEAGPSTAWAGLESDAAAAAAAAASPGAPRARHGRPRRFSVASHRLLAVAVALLLVCNPASAAARPGRSDPAATSAALAATRSLLEAVKAAAAAAPAAAAAAAPPPPPSPSMAALEGRLASANAVLALRKAGLLPGNARLPASMQAKTVDAVNAAAPAYAIPGVGLARPVLAQEVGGGPAAPKAAGHPAAAGEKKWGPPAGWLATAPSVAPRPGFDAGPAVPTDPVRQPAGVNATGPLADLMAAAQAAAPAPPKAAPAPSSAATAAAAPHDKALDGRVKSNALIGELGGLGADQSTGSVIQAVGGFRVATPWFGTGFNFCVDRYFGSFPKVGIVIPNAAAWLLPDLASIFGEDPLKATVNLPGPGAGLPKGGRADATSDGFVLWMPTTQPLFISNFGFRYSLQVAQLFGVDFGFGILKIGCRVDFVRV